MLEQALRLLHPFMPYITEELWQRLPAPVNNCCILPIATPSRRSCWLRIPEAVAALIDEAAEWEMQAVIDLISRVRNIRSEMNIKPGEPIPC